ncbi:MAG: hypothetical protein ACJAQT_001619 [Akkermansiaceae bacterium]|jgi:hypothetical protein
MRKNLLHTFWILFLVTGFLAKADEPLVWELARAEVADVTEVSEAVLRIAVTYESSEGVSGRSFDDGDLRVTQADGFYSGVSFVEWNPVTPRPGPNGELPPIRQQTAIYELAAPEGGWSESDNGEYEVMLAGDEVLKEDGSHFSMALAGSFRVMIGEVKVGVPALGGEFSVETFATPGAPGGNVSERVIATVTAIFPHPVEVNWGEVSMTADGGFCVEVEGCQVDEIVPQVLTTYTKRVELGMLEPGEYQGALKSNGEVLAEKSFRVGGGSGELDKGVPSKVEIELVKLPTRGLYPVYAANVRLTFGQYVERVEWSEASRKENLFGSEVTAWVDSRILLVAPMVIEHQVYLGMTLPGEYRYELSSLKEVIGRSVWTVGDVNGDVRPPTVMVNGATVTEAGEEALEFSVEFFDEGELVMVGIEAQVLTAMNRKGEVIEIERTSLNFTADFTAGAIATYRMQPPGRSWGAEDRGRYRLILSEPELVCDLFGNHLRDGFIGYVRVEIEREDPEPVYTAELTIRHDELIGRWAATVRLFVPEDLAGRDDWSVNWGEVRPVGPSFFARPRFVRAGSNEGIGEIPPSNTMGAGMWVEHDYDLGSISGGTWVVCVQSNLGHFAKERLVAGGPNEGSDMEPFDFWRDWSDRETGLSDERLFWEYSVGTDPGDASDDHEGDPKPELIAGEDGGKHFGLRCRIASAAVDTRLRFEGSSDMATWIELGPDEIEEVERVAKEGGIEEFVVCLVEKIETAEIRYLRVVAERW